MKEVNFPNWKRVLAQEALPECQKKSFEITIQWHLSFCRRGRGGVTVQSARDFIQWASQEKQPKPWQVEQWKEAIRWFFRRAKESIESRPDETSLREEAQVWLPEEKAQWPEWKLAFMTVLRRRKYSIRTEPHVMQKKGLGVKSPLDL